MNNKIHKIDSSVTPAPAKTYAGPATAGIEFEMQKMAVRVVPDALSTERYIPPTLFGAGAPTNGTSGTGATFMGTGSFYWDTTNKVSYVNSGSKASPSWTLEGSSQPAVVNASGDAAVAKGSVTSLSKGSAAAMTLAAPSAGAVGTGDDGIMTIITSDSAFAHVITFTGSKLDSGSAAVATATFNPNKGASLTVMAMNGRWKVLSGNGVSFA